MAAERETARAVKRRGILAAAGAVVAGIAAKQAARPVAAAGNLVLETNNNEAAGTAITWTAGAISTGAAFTVIDNGTATTNILAMVAGVATGGKAPNGVYGEASYGVKGVGDAGGVYGVSATGSGVYGTTVTGAEGVRGYSANSNGMGGYTGATSGGFAGVYGYGNGSGTFGVVGNGFGGAGVLGQNGQYGVVGMPAVGVFNPANTIGVWGYNTSTGSAPMGVRGDCTNGIGVYGSTSAAYQYAVCGQVLVDNAFGITGIANGNNCVAFAGGTTNANSFAASFQGHVQVFGGAFDVLGAGNKHAIVPHPDGSHRTIYSVESPECWVEDFGEGMLSGGKAEVALDKDFAALIHTDHYHVFLTEHGGHHGLHTTAKSGGGFVVEASPLLLKAAGLSAAQVSGSFSWRVVAKPKTDAKVDRLAKATLAPKVDMTKLPKQPPAPPTAAAPPKKP